MGQKVNPISLRIQATNRYFNYSWYNNYYYTKLLTEDLIIQKYINSIFKLIQYPAGSFFIQNSQKKIKVFIFFCSPLFSRKIRSNFFKTKYYIITKKSSILKKKITFRKNNEKLNYDKLLYFCYLVLQKYFNFFYGSSKYCFQPNEVLNSTLKIMPTTLVSRRLQKFILFLKKRKMMFSFFKSNKQLGVSKLNDNHLISTSQSNIFKDIKGLNVKLFRSLLSNQHKKKNVQNKKFENKNLAIDYKSPFLINFFHYNNKSKENKDLYFFLKIFTFKKHFENILTKQLHKNVNLYLIKTKDHFRSASFLADEIVYYLKKRIPFYRIKTRLIKEVKFLPAIKGIRITCSGRVGGRSKKAQRAKKKTIQYGQTSLHVFSSHIDFSSKKVLNKFGLIGVKVWISYNE